jgi:alkanesulfonate monooxygenase SsuD/methylene tetrahydromethanopterin reductase-like flavin-dependent oxidoreductase (luciferase family)
MRERVEAIKAIWTNDEAEYHGEQVDFGPIWCWPKPLQLPHPPIVVGGNGPKVLDRVLGYGDEWMPNRVPPEACPGASRSYGGAPPRRAAAQSR